MDCDPFYDLRQHQFRLVFLCDTDAILPDLPNRFFPVFNPYSHRIFVYGFFSLGQGQSRNRTKPRDLFSRICTALWSISMDICPVVYRILHCKLRSMAVKRSKPFFNSDVFRWHGRIYFWRDENNEVLPSL